MSDYTPLRWGILGAGSIAHRFTESVIPLADQKVTAVGSRDLTKANAFADRHGIPNRHDSYEALCADPEVDAIYVATPHNFHKDHSILALRSGKHVLCEKPFTINRAEAQAMVDVAKETGLFLMEGMWSRFFPAWAKVRELVKSGAIGKPRMLVADFGFRGGKTGADGLLEGVNPEARLFNPDLGGGALMDVGIYPVSIAQMLFGAHSQIAALATIGHTGVDENTGMVLQYSGGEIAMTSTSLQINTTQVAYILGTDGKIEVSAPWWTPRRVVLTQKDNSETFDFAFEPHGFQFEAIHFAERLRAGHTESDVLSHADSLDVMKSLDDLRAAIGLKYPME